MGKTDVESAGDSAHLAVLAWVGPVLFGISKAWTGSHPAFISSNILFLSFNSVAHTALSYRFGMRLPGFQWPSAVRSSSENSSCLAQVANRVLALCNLRSFGSPEIALAALVWLG